MLFPVFPNFLSVSVHFTFYQILSRLLNFLTLLVLFPFLNTILVTHLQAIWPIICEEIAEFVCVDFIFTLYRTRLISSCATVQGVRKLTKPFIKSCVRGCLFTLCQSRAPHLSVRFFDTGAHS